MSCTCGIPDSPNELGPRDPNCPAHGDRPAPIVAGYSKDEVVARVGLFIIELLYRMEAGETLTITRNEDLEEMFHIRGGVVDESRN